MDATTALKCLIQLEKIKTGILWCQQCAQQLEALPRREQTGAARILEVMVAQLDHELALARHAYPQGSWTQAGKSLDMAAVMISSGVPQESAYHLSQALRVLMNSAGEAARVLRRQGLL
ncbi:MAG: hypothetical protein WBG37_08995 [Desulfobacterales bacterium]|jgi:hypothetical protein